MAPLKKLQTRGVAQGQTDIGNLEIGINRYGAGIQPQITRYSAGVVVGGDQDPDE